MRALGIGVLVIVLVVGVVLVATNHSKKSGSQAGQGEIFAEPAASSGRDPFTDSVASATPTDTVPLADPVSLGSSSATTPDLRAVGGSVGGAGGATTPTRSFSGGAPGLYGGTRDKHSCDIDKLASFLAANPAKEAAWAEAQGIPVDQVPSFVRGLTPVLLRADTRVTNYGYLNGHANPIQSVLEAGTAVLVDQYGEPQAKCNCGTPLNPPRAVPVTPVYTGPKWPSFTPAAITVVRPSPVAITVIVLVDVESGTPFGRPTGPSAGSDQPLPGGSGPASGGTTTTSPPGTSTTSPPTTTAATTGTSPYGDPFTIEPGGTACESQLTGIYLEHFVVSSTDTQPHIADQPNANGCYRIVISGETDLNTNDNFQGGYDAVYCYDPNYCTGQQPTATMSHDIPIWKAFGFTDPPPYNPNHVYTFIVKVTGDFTDRSGGFSIGLHDSVYTDNSGSWTVDIYG